MTAYLLRENAATIQVVVGYSGTPLSKKLGLRAGTLLFLVNAPSNYQDLVSPPPVGVKVLNTITADIDMVHIFSTKVVELETALQSALNLLKPDGIIGVSWPKKTSKVASDVSEDTIEALAIPLGLVDVKVCAVDSAWSALKLVIRKELRKQKCPPHRPERNAVNRLT